MDLYFFCLSYITMDAIPSLTALGPNVTAIFNIKFIVGILILILVRGGTPRYRYDYLTKLGWLKFLNMNLILFFLLFITYYAY